MEMIVYEIGTFVLSVLLYAIPILTACSFIYNWSSFFQIMLILLSLAEFIMFTYIIADIVSRGE